MFLSKQTSVAQFEPLQSYFPMLIVNKYQHMLYILMLVTPKHTVLLSKLSSHVNASLLHDEIIHDWRDCTFQMGRNCWKTYFTMIKVIHQVIPFYWLLPVIKYIFHDAICAYNYLKKIVVSNIYYILKFGWFRHTLATHTKILNTLEYQVIVNINNQWL